MVLDFPQVVLGVVGRVMPVHRTYDFQPAMGQAAQRTRVTLPLRAMGLVIGCSPRTVAATQIRPQVQCGS